MLAFLRRLFFPDEVAKEEARRLVASNPGAGEILAFLKTSPRDCAVDVIRASNSDACRQALVQWQHWVEQRWPLINRKTIEELRAEAAAYFSQLGSPRGTSGGASAIQFPGLGPVTVMDFRSDDEKAIEQHARSGGRVGQTFDAIVMELVAIGQRVEYTCLEKNRTREYDQKDRHKRAYEIGRLLNAAGGMKLMQAAAYRVRCAAGLVPGNGRDLERCWDGIGDWQG